jgi:hypothetical protein
LVPGYGLVVCCLSLLTLLGGFVEPGYAASVAVAGEQHRTDQRYEAPARISDNLNPLPDDLNPADLLAQTAYPVLDEDARGQKDLPPEKKETIEPITRLVPLWGEQAREKGFDLPLPFGFGVNLVFMDQGLELKKIKVGIGDPTFEVKGLAFSDARAHDRANTARLDVWLLPFVNIYGIFGYINGEAELDLDIGNIASSLPPIGLPPILTPGQSVDLNIDYNGTTYGGGLTLAGGYQNFFASVDGNFTYSNIDVVDSKIKTYTISPRVGLLVDSAAIPGSLALWVGGMYMKYKQTITDDINLNEFDSRLPSVIIDFKLDIENDQPWNFLFGGQWEITKRWQFMAEGGVGDRTQMITGLYFRF